MPARAGEPPDIGDAPHAVPPQQRDERLERVRRVPDREDAPLRHGAQA
jgi:hypothetical protein